MIVAAVGGVAFLWAPGIPAVLLTIYIAHLRAQERRRFEVKIDQRRAAEAAKRLRDARTAREHAPEVPEVAEPAPLPCRRSLPPPTAAPSWSRPTTRSGSTSSARPPRTPGKSRPPAHLLHRPRGPRRTRDRSRTPSSTSTPTATAPAPPTSDRPGVSGAPLPGC